jgi:hypothetical protein
VELMQQRSLFLKLLCVLDALFKLLESYYGIWIRGFFFFFSLGGATYCAPWRDFTGVMGPLNQTTWIATRTTRNIYRCILTLGLRSTFWHSSGGSDTPSHLASNYQCACVHMEQWSMGVPLCTDHKFQAILPSYESDYYFEFMLVAQSYF